MYYVYILKSVRDGRFYTGFTNDLERRVQEHNKGKHSTPATINRGPFKLIHVELTENRDSARKLEKFFKSGSGREIRDEIIKYMVVVAQW